MARRRRGRAILTISTATIATVVVGVLALSRGLSYAREVPQRLISTGCLSASMQGFSGSRRDVLKIRHLQHRLRHQGTQQAQIFAATQEEAEKKIIQKLMQARQEAGNSADDRTISPSSIGFCDQKLSDSERETLTSALTTLRLPEDSVQLALEPRVTDSETLSKQNAVRETAHRVVQSTLGNDRYQEVFRACRLHEKNEYERRKENEQQGAQEIFYRALGFTPDQRLRMSGLVEQTLRELYPPEPVEMTDDGSIGESLLDEQGRIPEFHATQSPSRPADESPLTEIPQQSHRMQRLELDVRAQFNNLMTEEQRAFFNRYREQLLPFSSMVFDLWFDAVLKGDELEKSAEATKLVPQEHAEASRPSE